MGLFGIGGDDYEDPQKEANKYLNQIPGIGHQYYDPYINEGNQARDLLKQQYGQMLNPTEFMNKIFKNYGMSQGAQYQRDQLGKGIGNTAAAGGFAGTPEHQRQYGEMADKIMSQDMQQYLQNALGIYGKGLSGEQDFYDKGFQSSNSLVDMLANILSSQAGMGYRQAQEQNASDDSFWNSATNLFSQGIGSYLGF